MKLVFLAILSLGICLIPVASFAAESYEGSSFNEVLNIIQDVGFTPKSKIEKQEFSVYAENFLPQYPVNSSSIFSGDSEGLQRDAQRTVNERFDYYDRLAKKLHPNGVCVSGEWIIKKKTQYTGLFATASRGLFIGRISVSLGDTTTDDQRGFGFAGKVFPTMDPNQVVSTGNFFTVDVLMGTRLDHALDAKTTNEPETGFKLSLIGLGLRIASALSTADENPGFRPLTQVASIGVVAPNSVVEPHWIRLVASGNLRRNDEPDFRNEIIQALDENKGLKYFIEVSETTKDRNATSGWLRIGEINLDSAQVSYGCDRRLHFAHPKLN
jgi:hypothetical protein